MRLLIVIAIILPLAIAGRASAQDRTFGDFDCTDDCSGHAAGFKWAEKKGITNEYDCPYANNSQSFQEGCIAYTRDPSIDADSDDSGHAVGESVSHTMDDDDDDDQ